MARLPRTEEAGAVHHIYARGNRGVEIFRDDADRAEYLRLLGLAVRWRHWRCFAYCLMTNHLHLLIETPKPNLGAGMQWLHGKYALGFNERHGFVGHVFQGRYGARRIKDDVHLVTALRYVENNADNSGMRDWPWTSARSRPPWLATERLGALLRGDPV